MGPRTAMAGCLAIVMLGAAACDPLTGTGPGTPPDPKSYIHSDPATKTTVITLIEPSWSTPDPTHGLSPGQSATFVFSPSTAGSYRIASLVGGSEASGMWADLEVTIGGAPAMRAEG